ncbi:MAG: SDR family oxidoreductase [Acidimicrobiia bacterium]
MTDWGPFSLAGKNAIVTGGGAGIGWACVERMVTAGASIVLADLDPDQAAGKVAGLDRPDAVSAIAVDVTNSDAGRTLVDHCVSKFGKVDILVNNAGIYPMVPMLEIDEALFRKVIDVNLVGLAFISKAVAEHMIEAGGGGRIINMASIDGLHPSMVGLAAYDASKGGVVMFTRNLALELAPHGIAVNAIAPGGITTEGTEASRTAPEGMTVEEMEALAAQMLAAKVPMGRMGEPHEIANAVVFLASEAASYMTGEVVVIDGGTLLT